MANVVYMCGLAEGNSAKHIAFMLTLFLFVCSSFQRLGKCDLFYLKKVMV